MGKWGCLPTIVTQKKKTPPHTPTGVVAGPAGDGGHPGVVGNNGASHCHLQKRDQHHG